MTQFKFTFFFLILAFATIKVIAQSNASMAVLPSNSGIVAVGETNDFLMFVGNTGMVSIAVSKLRPICTVPPTVVFLPNDQQTDIPAGWTILSNTGTQLRVCNSSFVVPGQSVSNIILKVRGVTISPATTFTGQINFGNGTTCAPGTQVAGNNSADDFATSTIEVIAGVLPVTLLSFNATLSNCQPVLKWLTESEINSDRFEIERGNLRNSTWKSIGLLSAKGNGGAKTTYNFLDSDLDNTSEKVLYRLKMIDKDGQYKYSKILPVLINCKTKQVEVYPNPVKDGRLYVNLTGANGYTEATLLSLTGQVIMKQVIKNGTNYLNISPGIAAGLYLLNIKDENGVDKKTKVLIQH